MPANEPAAGCCGDQDEQRRRHDPSGRLVDGQYAEEGEDQGCDEQGGRLIRFGIRRQVVSHLRTPFSGRVLNGVGRPGCVPTRPVAREVTAAASGERGLLPRARGSSTTNRAPPPGRSSTHTDPWCRPTWRANQGQPKTAAAIVGVVTDAGESLENLLSEFGRHAGSG